MTISWSDPDDSSITGYQILRRNVKTDAKGDFAVIENETGSAATTYTDTTVKSSSSYGYRTKAANTQGLSPQSGFVRANTPAAPSSSNPQGLTGVVAYNSVSLSWDDPGDDSITGYQVLRRVPAVQEAGGFVIVVDETGSNATSYVDSTTEPETTYFYRVKARNSHGLSAPSAYFKANTPAAPRPPKPLGLTGVVSHDTVSLSWDDPEDDSIIGYQVLRRDPAVQEEGESVIVVDDTGSNATSYVDSTTEPETTYLNRVKARN